MSLYLNPEERRKLFEQGAIKSEEPKKMGRPRVLSSFGDKPVCKARGCFNYVENKGDAYCQKCSERTQIKP